MTRTGRVSIALALAAALSCGSREPRLLVLATTTSVANSGLLDRVLPVYEQEASVRTGVSAVGSGRWRSCAAGIRNC